MKRLKAQTATEYIVIVAVVIVIAVVVASILGEFPGIGSSSSKKIDDYKLTTTKVAVDSYATFEAENYTLIKIRNNHFDTLVANNITVTGLDCNYTNITLNIGQSYVVNCTGVLEEGVTPDIQIVWTDVATDASYTVGESSETVDSLSAISVTPLALQLVGDDQIYRTDDVNITMDISVVN